MVLPIIRLIIAALVPVAVTYILFRLEEKGSFRELSYAKKQGLIGLIFGIISIMGTEMGIPLNGVVVNCRDAAPVIAGLLFGAPSGIIAGFIGGIERWFAVYWGIGEFTRVACSVSTCIAGIIAGLVRKYMFNNARPYAEIAFGTGFIVEVFHLCMVFLTNTDDPTRAIMVVDTCFVPMVSAVSMSVLVSTIVASRINHDERRKLFTKKEHANTPIFEEIQVRLVSILMIAFLVITAFIYVLQSRMATNSAKEKILNTVEEISDDIIDESDEQLLAVTRMIGREVNFGRYDIDSLIDRYDVSEIVVVDPNGIVIDSNVEDYIGFDMASGEQSAEFMCLLNGKKEMVQDYGPIAQNPSVSRKYAGVAVRQGFVQAAYNADQFQASVDTQIDSIANNRHMGKGGAVVITDINGQVVSCTKGFAFGTSDGYGEEDIANLTVDELNEIYANDQVDLVYYKGVKYYFVIDEKEGYSILAFYAYDDAVLTLKVSVYVSLFSILLILAIVYVLIYLIIKLKVVNQIVEMTHSLNLISGGNLNEEVNVRSSREFSSLSDDINATVATLKRYIAEAAERIDSELKFAKSIQESTLPEPIIDERGRFEIYAYMKTAKEVGGDFYDFYMTKNETLNFLIADVSGKGIPAAMFMMRAKSVLRSLTERGMFVDDVFTAGNDSLCEENDAGMFVTAWQGALNLISGELYFVNAGHNFPAIMHEDGSFEFMKQKVNLVLAGMEGIPYTLNEYQLQHGDTIFLYTDGVTEATSGNNELYGDDRLLSLLNSRQFDSLKDMCESVQKDMDDFIDGAPQFDDITMVALKYL